MDYAAAYVLLEGTYLVPPGSPLRKIEDVDRDGVRVAGVRTAMVAGLQRVPGGHVMSGRFMTIPQAAGVPRGRSAAARQVRQFIEEMKASGFVAAALKRHGLGPDDAVVAPPQPATP